MSTVTFELHAKVAEEIYVEMSSYGQLSEVQMLRDLDFDVGWDHGHINIYSTCRTSSVPNHVTVAQGWARDVNGRDRDETETRRLQVSRRDRDVEVHVYCH